MSKFPFERLVILFPVFRTEDEAKLLLLSFSFSVEACCPMFVDQSFLKIRSGVEREKTFFLKIFFLFGKCLFFSLFSLFLVSRCFFNV